MMALELYRVKVVATEIVEVWATNDDLARASATAFMKGFQAARTVEVVEIENLGSRKPR